MNCTVIIILITGVICGIEAVKEYNDLGINWRTLYFGIMSVLLTLVGLGLSR